MSTVVTGFHHGLLASGVVEAGALASSLKEGVKTMS